MSTAWGPGNAHEKELIRLMDTYGGMLFSLCRMMLHDYHRAQDAVQDTFIKVYRRLEQLPDLRNEKAWLIRIAMNVCHDTLRSSWFKHVMRAVDFEELPDLPAPQDAEEQDSELMDMIRSLPTKEREVLLLYYWQSLSPDEIANTLHISRATVYRRLEQARNDLKLNYEGGLQYD